MPNLKRKLKVHTVLMYIHGIMALACIGSILTCIIGIECGNTNKTVLTVIAIHQGIICAYASYITIIYDNSVERLKRKLNKAN